MGGDAETVRGYEGGNRGRRVGWSTTTTVSGTPSRAHTVVFFPPIRQCFSCMFDLSRHWCLQFMPLRLAFVFAVPRFAVTPRRSGSEMTALDYLEWIVGLAPDVKCRASPQNLYY